MSGEQYCHSVQDNIIVGAAVAKTTGLLFVSPQSLPSTKELPWLFLWFPWMYKENWRTVAPVSDFVTFNTTASASSETYNIHIDSAF